MGSTPPPSSSQAWPAAKIRRLDAAAIRQVCLAWFSFLTICSYVHFATVHGLPEALRRAPQTPQEIPLHLKFDSLIAVMWSCSVAQHLVQELVRPDNESTHGFGDFLNLYAKFGTNWLAHFIEHDQERFLCDLLIGMYFHLLWYFIFWYLIGLKECIPDPDKWKVSIFEDLEIGSVMPASPISKLSQLFPFLKSLWKGDPWMWSQQQDFSYHQKLRTLFPRENHPSSPPIPKKADCFFRFQADGVAHPQLFFVDKALQTCPSLAPLLLALAESTGFTKINKSLASNISCLLQRLSKSSNKKTTPSFGLTFAHGPPPVSPRGPRDITPAYLHERVAEFCGMCCDFF